MTNNPSDWWRGGVLYQVYPRSFQDSNNDGIGDLRGITRRLPYLADLGVDGLWISPFFQSPMRDFGYDVSDYKAIDPQFGTLDDFRHLLDKAHKLNLKIIIDLVMSHTSDQHAWFQESMKDRSNPRADWYIWADPKPDGTPPNNWQSVFGGPAWEYCSWRGQYYMHNFLKEQPDLNFHNPDVVDAVMDIFEYWLDFGVDGFRLDVVNYYMHDPRLWDNPPQRDMSRITFNLDFPTPYLMQEHRYDKSQPDNLYIIRRIRSLIDQYGGRMTVGEIGDELHGLEMSARYTEGHDKLHTAYNFSLLSGPVRSAAHIRKAVEDFEAVTGNSWASWAFSNHDVIRSASRWSKDGKVNPATPKLMLALLCSLRGTPFIYQGEELGLPEAHIPYDRIQDPWGKYLYPKWQGRDGCRTPMPWTGGHHGGFSHHEPWLPMPQGHRDLNVRDMMRDPQSTLRFTRAFLNWRKNHPALRDGTILFLNSAPALDQVLMFERDCGAENILCLFNLGDTPVTLPRPGKTYQCMVHFDGDKRVISDIPDAEITLDPWGFRFLLTDRQMAR